MKRTLIKTMLPAMVLMLITISIGHAVMTYDAEVNYNKFVKYDRYLDAEIWVDDDSYYEGEDIDISFRANKDCYVAIYNIDTKGRVNLIFPNSPTDNNYLEANAIYSIPDRNDSYEFKVQGPEGIEYLQIVASSRPIDIPDWYGGSGIVCDVDPYDFMDYINANYFGGEEGLPRAFDLTSFAVKEWHRYYFRPYHTHYYDPWDWTYCGSVYIDYPFGATIYIDGVYWGIAPLFIPRIYFGWHYITVYDHSGWCWEDRIDVVRHRSIVLDNTVVRTKANVRSRFKDVTSRGYLNPVKNGYPDYKEQIRVKETYKPVSTVAGSGRIKYAAEKDTRTIRDESYKYRTNSSSTGSTAERRETYKSTGRQTKESATREKVNTRTETRRSTAKERDNTNDRTYRTTKTERSSDATETRTYKRSSNNSSNRSSSGTRSKSSGSSSRVTTRSSGNGSSGNSGSTGNSSGTRTKSGGGSGGVERRGK